MTFSSCSHLVHTCTLHLPVTTRRYLLYERFFHKVQTIAFDVADWEIIARSQACYNTKIQNLSVDINLRYNTYVQKKSGLTMKVNRN